LIASHKAKNHVPARPKLDRRQIDCNLELGGPTHGVAASAMENDSSPEWSHRSEPVDRSFTADVGENESSMAIVSAIIGLARGLDMITTAEGRRVLAASIVSVTTSPLWAGVSIGAAMRQAREAAGGNPSLAVGRTPAALASSRRMKPGKQSRGTAEGTHWRIVGG
jgi:hypothetical protein